jgi:sigma-E factor negative regulatory protein RseA
MNGDDQKEQISSFLDGALDHWAGGRTIGHLEDDQALRGVWDRYHLIGDIMRGEGARPRAEGIAEAVSRRIAEEPAVLAPRNLARRGLRRWLRPVAGGALAASVAVVVVLKVPGLIDKEPEKVAEVGHGVAPVRQMVGPGTRWRHVDPEVESRLNRYLVDHGESAARGPVPRVLPYASFVSYDEGR